MDISMKWFKDQIKKELGYFVTKKAEKATEQLAQEDLGMVPVVEEKVRHYKVAKLVGNTLTVVFESGNILTKQEATKEDFERVTNSESVEEIHDIMSNPVYLEQSKKEAEERQKIVEIARGVDTLSKSNDFVVEQNTVYMKDLNGSVIKRSLPQQLVEGFAEILGAEIVDESRYSALKKFWLKCCMNPNAQSAEDLYVFLKNHQFSIDNHGNFYAYRRVVSKGSANRALVEFVSQAYTKIKGVWKKKPSDYNVYYADGSYSFSKLHHEGDLGNLEKLYIDLPNLQEKSYTSAHTGKEDYRIGEVMSMPRQDGDDNNGASCSKGFHAASKAYDYSGFGDTPILMIINPMDVLAVPKGEVGKLRTCRWFFATTLVEGEKYILDDEDFDVSELGDIFEEKCSKDVVSYVQNSFAEEVKRHTFTLSSVSMAEIKGIVASLDDMREAISGRVKSFAV